MSRLSGKVALVTGASRGIGAAIARRLAADGARVAINYHRSEQAAEQVVAEVRSAGGEAVAVRADLGDLGQIDGLFRQVMAAWGRLDILVNNAGVGETCPLSCIDPAHYGSVFDVNVRGLLFATQAAVRLMGPSGGHIINMTSGITRVPPPGSSVYTASKAAVDAITRSLAGELGPRGITINGVAPGITETDMLPVMVPAEVQVQMVRNTALGRLGTPEDIADVVAFLVSEDARWITGEIIGVSGGLR